MILYGIDNIRELSGHKVSNSRGLRCLCGSYSSYSGVHKLSQHKTRRALWCCRSLLSQTYMHAPASRSPRAEHSSSHVMCAGQPQHCKEESHLPLRPLTTYNMIASCPRLSLA